VKFATGLAQFQSISTENESGRGKGVQLVNFLSMSARGLWAWRGQCLIWDEGRWFSPAWFGEMYSTVSGLRNTGRNYPHGWTNMDWGGGEGGGFFQEFENVIDFNILKFHFNQLFTRCFLSFFLFSFFLFFLSFFVFCFRLPLFLSCVTTLKVTLSCRSELLKDPGTLASCLMYYFENN